MLPKSLQPYKVLIYLTGVILVLLVIAYGIYDMNKPAKGTWRFGVCRSFIETYIRFPNTLHINEVSEKATEAELTVSYLNAHGFRPTRAFECTYEQTANGIIMKEIRVDKDKLSQKLVDNFNIAIPFLITDPDLETTLPDMGDYSLEAMKP